MAWRSPRSGVFQGAEATGVLALRRALAADAESSGGETAGHLEPSSEGVARGTGREGDGAGSVAVHGVGLPGTPASHRDRGVRLLKRGPRSRVYFVEAPTPDEGAAVVKILPRRGVRRLLPGTLGSSAAALRRAAQMLRANGFEAPRPLATATTVDGRGQRIDVYVAEAADGFVPLRAAMEALGPRRRRELCRALGGYLARLHVAGVHLPDCKDDNLFVAPDGDGWAFSAVDLDRVRRPWPRVRTSQALSGLVGLERTLLRGRSRFERLAVAAGYLASSPAVSAPEASAVHRVGSHALVEQLERAKRVKDREVARRRRRAGIPGDGPLPVSALVITGNEIHRIRDCLDSLAWCDEIIVIDSFSTDGTFDVCRQYTPHVERREWQGHVVQKQRALDLARRPWALNLDADEYVTPELRDEMLEVLDHDGGGYDGFFVPRLVHYLGRWWWYGGWYPDARLRLFRRERALWGGVDPHEKVLLEGRTSRLRRPILHFTYDSVSDHLRTVNRFTTTASAEKAARGRRVSWGDLTGRPLARFIRFWVLRQGFRLGKPGLFVAVTAALYAHLKYAKLDERMRGRAKS